MTRQHKHRNYKDYSKVGSPKEITVTIDVDNLPLMCDGREVGKNEIVEFSKCYYSIPISYNGPKLDEKGKKQLLSQIKINGSISDNKMQIIDIE